MLEGGFPVAKREFSAPVACGFKGFPVAPANFSPLVIVLGLRSHTRFAIETKVHGERERLKQLKAAHAGVNAKAWDTSHASLDKELAKFQKFLKSKARRIAEEQVLQVRLRVGARTHVYTLPNAIREG